MSGRHSLMYGVLSRQLQRSLRKQGLKLNCIPLFFYSLIVAGESKKTRIEILPRALYSRKYIYVAGESKKTRIETTSHPKLHTGDCSVAGESRKIRIETCISQVLCYIQYFARLQKGLRKQGLKCRFATPYNLFFFR